VICIQVKICYQLFDVFFHTWWDCIHYSDNIFKPLFEFNFL
jgi:hypothetical protein